MYNHFVLILLILNMPLSLIVSYICLRNLNRYSCKYNLKKRLEYVVLLALVLLMGFQPFFWFEEPSASCTLIILGVLAYLVSDKDTRNRCNEQE